MFSKNELDPHSLCIRPTPYPLSDTAEYFSPVSSKPFLSCGAAVRLVGFLSTHSVIGGFAMELLCEWSDHCGSTVWLVDSWWDSCAIGWPSVGLMCDWLILYMTVVWLVVSLIWLLLVWLYSDGQWKVIGRLIFGEPVWLVEWYMENQCEWWLIHEEPVWLVD